MRLRLPAETGRAVSSQQPDHAVTVSGRENDPVSD